MKQSEFRKKSISELVDLTDNRPSDDDAETMKHIQERSFDECLQLLLEKSQQLPSLSIREVLEIISVKGDSLVLIFLSLLFCQPLQIPGLSTPFGVIIALFGLKTILGKPLWLPKRVFAKTISSSSLQRITTMTLRALKKAKRVIRPRFIWLSDHAFMKWINGAMIFLLGICLALPLPIPLTNFSAGWSILLISLGILENDGLFIIVGYLVFLITILFFIAVLFSIDIFMIDKIKNIIVFN